MKILYGVVGEGMGHAMRSQVIIKKLIEWGHEVEIVVSGRAFEFLKKEFSGVNKIWGLTMVMAENEVKKKKTIQEILKGAVSGWPDNLLTYMEMTDRFSPDCVISDFETWSALYGFNNRLPIICIDNIQALRRCKHPEEIISHNKKDLNLANSIIKSKIPGAMHYIITTFFDTAVKKDKTTIVPPILRDKVLKAKVRNESHVTVYQTSDKFSQFTSILKKFPETEFRIYGLKRNISEIEKEDNLTYCTFSEEKFIDDLASAKGVIGSAGYTLISESVYLGKPYLAIPVSGQFEQLFNARYIEYLGYGLYEDNLYETTLKNFLNKLSKYKSNLNNYKKSDNSILFDNLQVQLDRIERGNYNKFLPII